MTPTKRVIIEVLDYLKYKVINDDCTFEELRSLQENIADNLEINCTIKDLSERYKQSQNNVRNVLSRNLMPKPKRKVYYSFSKFLRFIPKSWVRSASDADADTEA